MGTECEKMKWRQRKGIVPHRDVKLNQRLVPELLPPEGANQVYGNYTPLRLRHIDPSKDHCIRHMSNTVRAPNQHHRQNDEREQEPPHRQFIFCHHRRGSDTHANEDGGEGVAYVIRGFLDLRVLDFETLFTIECVKGLIKEETESGQHNCMYREWGGKIGTVEEDGVCAADEVDSESGECDC